MKPLSTSSALSRGTKSKVTSRNNIFTTERNQFIHGMIDGSTPTSSLHRKWWM